MPDANTSSDAAEACPVDHKSREAWLKQARAASGGDAAPANPHTQGQLPPSYPTLPTPPTQAQTQSQSSWASTFRSYIPFAGSAPPQDATPTQSAPASHRKFDLDTNRVVSTIPRTGNFAPGADSACPVPHGPGAAPSPGAASPAAASHGQPPANSEADTGADPATGNWVYPSEKMFFDAMRRKGHDAVQTADMKTVVPIHNAVNERAWKEIKEWERPYTEGTACAGPRLHSFSGYSDRMSPKARVNTILGYTAPFDRHDWVVDRCGVQIEYVIDFYAGRPGGAAPSFYLDVRPKLNSWEGVKMRALRGIGLS